MPSQKTLEHYLRQLRLIESHREKWCEENVRRHYRDLNKDLQEFLGVQYAQLAQDDKLTYEILHQKGQYARFIEEVEQRINKFTPKAAQEIKNTVQLTYKKCFEGMVDAVEKSKDYEQLKVNLKGVRAVTPDVVKNVVKNSFLEDALEKNHKTVIYDIKQQIGVGLTQGDRMSTMAKRISEQIDSDYKKSVRIARTECHRVREAGFQDSSERISQTLKDSNSDYVMTKTWKTMQDMSVRPYRKKGKKGFIMGKGPNHVKMEGVTILVDEEFDLGNGVKAKTPGQSGVAGHDINCRCYLSRDLMTKAEFEKLTGRKLTKTDPVTQYEQQEQALLDEKSNLEQEKEKLVKRQQNLETYQYNIWGENVTPADYETNKDRLQIRREYLTTHTPSDKYAAMWQQRLEDIDNFEAQGKTYSKLSKQIKTIDDRLLVIDDEIKSVRAQIMKAKGIDVKKMQSEIDNLTKKNPVAPRTDSAKILNGLQSHANSNKINYDYTLDKIARRHKMSVDDVKVELSNTLTEIIDECDVGMRIRVDNLKKVLNDSDGGFKNLFETGKGGGCTNFSARGNGEQRVFGYSKAVPTGKDVEDRPIYGMMIPNLKTNRTIDAIDYINAGPGAWYGDGVTCVIKKNKIFNNASFTLGDSLDYSWDVCGSTFDDPQFNGSSRNIVSASKTKTLLDKSKNANEKLMKAFDSGDNYMEVQIHGKENHSSDIIEKVYFNDKAFNKAKREGLIDMLDRKKIPYEVLKK